MGDAVRMLVGGPSWGYVVGFRLAWRAAKEARAYYVTLAVATARGAILNSLPFDPIRALYWSAVINGIKVAPIIVL
jgi:hypothetical protein